MPSSRTLGTLLRHAIEQFDDAVERRYRAAGLGYKPRYTPVVRALLDLQQASLRDIARHAQITHSAVSQTVAEMRASGLVEAAAGADAREHVVRLTAKATRIVPRLRSIWVATNNAVERLDKELPYPLTSLLADTIANLDQRSFEDRIQSEQDQLRKSEITDAKRRVVPALKASQKAGHAKRSSSAACLCGHCTDMFWAERQASAPTRPRYPSRRDSAG
jgi:DNA-binding MarR family transcriptional regulator